MVVIPALPPPGLTLPAAPALPAPALPGLPAPALPVGFAVHTLFTQFSFALHWAAVLQDTVPKLLLSPLAEQAAAAKSAKGASAASRNAIFVICLRLEVLAMGRTPWLKSCARSSASRCSVGEFTKFLWLTVFQNPECGTGPRFLAKTPR
jgi:hypothetical protein